MKDMITAVVFDCFGVLMIDAITAYQDIHPDVAQQLDELDRQADKGFITQSEQIAGYKELTDDDEATITTYLTKEHRLNQPIVELITELKQKYRVGMLSNIGTNWYQQLVPQTVRELFDVTVLSHEVGMVKPYPEIFEYLIAQFGTQPGEVLFIDDLQENCEGARAVGMQAIHYTNFEQTKKEIESILKQ